MVAGGEGGERLHDLVEMFQRSTARFADRPLFGVKRGGHYQWITYGEVARRVDEARAGLARRGVGPGDRVAMIANNRPEWAIAAYATYGLRAQFVPMYEAQLAKEWAYILRDSGAKVVFAATPEIYEQVAPLVGELPSLDSAVLLDAQEGDEAGFDALLRDGAAHPVPPTEPDPDDIAGFIYTSGTTGEPKGVLLSHRNITSNLNAIHEIYPMGEEDVSLSFLPWAHSFGQTCELHGLLSYGGALGLAESVRTIVDNLAEVRPTVLISVPRVFNRIYDGLHKRMAAEGGLKRALFQRTLDVAAQRRALEASGRSSVWVEAQWRLLDVLVGRTVRARFGGRLRYAAAGGAALAKEVAEVIDALGVEVYEGYGLTETAPVLTANRPGARKIGSVGRPISGVQIRIEPFDGAPPGEGEVVARGPNIMVGYHNRPKETAAVLSEDGWFRTGDMGRVDEDGFLWITGRVKEQYKLENGKYVVPAPLEEKLRLIPAVTSACVDGTNRPFNAAIIYPDFEVLRGWAQARGLNAPSDEALARHPDVEAYLLAEIERVGADFKSYERPRRVLVITADFTPEDDTLTPTLKLKRRNILARYEEQLRALYAS